MEFTYLESVKKQFAYYKLLGERTLGQVSDDQLGWQANAASNSLVTLVKHLAGNMLSRWTDFLESDGEKPWRERDEEFENGEMSREELMALWEKGWGCLFAALDSITDADLGRVIFIRNQGHTIGEAINRQLAHYPYHVGQMVSIGKELCGDDWASLSIPKGQSVAYNDEKFAKPKERAHFTDEMLKQGLKP